MKKINTFLAFLIFIGIFISACNQTVKNKTLMNINNPLLGTFNTPFGVPPFSEITAEDYKQAFEIGIKDQNAEIEKITANKEVPDFHNTIEALEFSGKLLKRANLIFENILSSNTNDTLQQIAKDEAPILSAHWDNILMNQKLFERINSVYQKKAQLKLNPEQSMLLKETYKTFVRGGAKLSAADKNKLKEINGKLSVLSLQFGDNVLADNNAFELAITDKKDLAGLPESVIEAAAETAKEKGKSGEWLFTLNKPSLIPFLQYDQNRELRKKMFQGYVMRGDNNNKNNNENLLKQMVNLRLEKAKLLGYPTYSDFVLEESMAKTPQAVFKLLGQITPAAIDLAKKERDQLQELSNKEGNQFKIKPWDWWFYAEKLRKEKYQLDDAELRPYFSLQDVRQGLFDVLNKLYGITFKLNKDIPTYQKEVQAYEVHEADGTLTGILYMDFFPRSNKQGGAWMTEYREQHYENGKNVIPVVSVNFNFTSPTKNKPALLSFDEVETMFHECGHAIHGLFSKCQYESLAGTSVPRDFVEMPSQILENWADEPEVLKSYAKNYKTGERIPDNLIKKMELSSRFNLGFTLTEYLAASYLDMDWHTRKEPFTGKVNDFENEAMKNIHLISEIVPRYRSTFFNHIFSGGYASGYYSYVWAEVIDADAFQAFKETSLFDKATATRFREDILSKGGTEDPMKLFKDFRGREPKADAYMKKKGLD
jgi:peptidyl-dipeptidase Dcp